MRGVKLGSALVLALLWLLMIVSALSVIQSSHQVRLQTNELEELRREASRLQVDWGRYLLEQSTWASFRRVDRMARETMGFQRPQPEQLVLEQDREVR